MSASKMGTLQKTVIEEVVTKHARTIQKKQGSLKSSQNSLKNLSREMNEPLEQREIESVEDWRDFLRATERDCKLITDIYSMLNNDMLQVKSAMANLSVSEPREEPLVSKREQGPKIYQDRGNPQ